MSAQQDRPQAQTFEKHTEIAKTDDERQIAVGVAMSPNEVDRQGDWESPETIQKLSDGYMEGLANGTAGNKVMHAVEVSDDTMTHVENRVLDTPEKVGDAGELPAGTWLVGKKVKDDSLWKMVKDGTLSGFSIGGRIHAARTHDIGDLPEGVEAAKAGDGTVREITDATVKEISLVDSPAVPSAQILTAKSGGDGFAKADPRLTAGVEVATEFLSDKRKNPPDAARELAEFLNRKESATSPTPSDDGASWVSKAKQFFTRRDSTSPNNHEMTDDETEKQGRTLNEDNVNRAMALHDIAIDMLDGTDVRQNRLRFSDDRSVPDFSLDEFESKVADPTGSGSGRDADADGDIETMNQDDKEDIASLVADKMSDNDDEQTEEKAESNAVITIEDGELTDEDRKALKDALSEAKSSEKADDLAETVEQLAENQQQILERIENAEGASQQKASGEGETPDDEMDALKAALG